MDRWLTAAAWGGVITLYALLGALTVAWLS